MTGSERRVAHSVAVACLVVAAFWFSWQLVVLILQVFAAVLVAVGLHALADPVARATRLPVPAAITLTAIALAVGIGLTLYLFGSILLDQVQQLIQTLPDAWAAFSRRFDLAELEQTFMRQAENAVPSGTTVLSFVTGFTSNLAGLLLGLFLVIAGGIYFALQPTLYIRGLLALFPHEARPAVRDKLTIAGTALRRFLKAQLIAMVLVGVMSGVGLAIIGVPSAAALGLFAGLAEFVPIVGPVAAAVPALLLAATVGFDTAIWALLLFTAVQQLEGNVLTPLLQQQIVSLPAAVTLFAVVAFGTVLGPLGIVLATPLTVLVFALASRPEPGTAGDAT